VRSKFALVIIACLAVQGPVWASPGGEKATDTAKAAGEPERAIGAPRAPTLDMPPLVAPVVVNGELHRYVYLSVSLKLNDDNQKPMMLAKVPYIQDAFLREVHGASIARDNDPAIVDEAALIARLVHACDTVVGEIGRAHV
jgi:flagellar basal body-associated protein FliL